VRHRTAFAALLAAGIALRAWTLWSWRPAFIGYYDSSPYVAGARTSLFADPFRPAGYPEFLRVLHALSDHVLAVTVLQHELGIATALLLYAAVRPCSKWAALLAPAVVLLDGFEVLVEHAVLSDSLFVFLLAAALLTTVRRSGLAAGALIALAASVRTVGLFVVPLVLLALFWPRQWRTGALGALAAAAVLGGYFAAEQAQIGATGLSRAPGWSLYARVGQFADCMRFTPPAGTAQLCETVDPARRPGTDFYYWAKQSPAQRAFGAPPADDAAVGRFAHAVLRAQPSDYLLAVGRDFTRYVWPNHFRRVRAGETQAQYIDQAQRPNELRFVGGELARYYAGVPAARQSQLTIAYVRATQVSGGLLLLLLALAAAAPFLARGGARRPATLLAATAVVLLLAPVATQVYDARYAVAALGPLAGAAGLALDAIAHRRRGRAASRGRARPPYST
jgi:hypothetical protein